MKISSAIEWHKQNKRILKKISNLPIEDRGIADGDFPYVRIRNGPIFYGPPSSQIYKRFYNQLSEKIKTLIPWECFGIAMNIIIRYQEAGLKLGGPKKEEQYVVKEGDYVAEMGAFRGYYIMNVARRVGDKGKIIAIEPIPNNLEYLKKNIKENKFKNVVIVPKGVWKESNRKQFFLKNNDMQSASIDLADEEKKRIELEVDSLDNILKENNVNQINFMIVQLNGAEYEALQGLTTINPKNLAIAARYNKKNKSAVDMINALLVNRGYNTKIRKKQFIYASKIS